MPDRPARPWYDPRARFAAISGPYSSAMIDPAVYVHEYCEGHYAGWNACIAAMGDRAGAGLLARLGLWLLQVAVALRKED